MRLDKVKNFFTEKNVGKHGLQVLKYLLVLSLILNIILAAVTFKAVNKKPRVVALDEDGVPYQMKEKKKELSRMINVNHFIDRYLDFLYDYHYKTIKQDLNRAQKLMSDKAWEALLSDYKEKNKIQRIRNRKVTNSIKVNEINVSSIKADKNEKGEQIGWKVTVEAIKIKNVDMIPRDPAKFEYEISFRKTSISKNIWGLEVYSHDEEEIYDDKL